MKKLKIACIVDEFTFICLQDSGELFQIYPKGWKADLEEGNPDIFFVESAWRGSNGSWCRRLLENKGAKIKEIVTWCRKKGIITVFWNKEDPVHFKEFFAITGYFDVVFTTDEMLVERYKRYLKRDKVYTLSFGINPKIHNPIGIDIEKKNKLCFTGSYYRTKYRERQHDFDRLITCSEKYGVDIYDRNFNKNIPKYKYPARYHEYIVGGVGAEKMEYIYKKYRAAINVNTVKQSPTMFSRRVVELLACGTPVISAYSLALANMFSDIVVSSDKEKELREEIERLFCDDEYYRKKRVGGIRRVMEKFVFKDMFLNSLKNAGIQIDNQKEKVSLLVPLRKKEDIKRARDIIGHQKAACDNIVFIDMSEKSWGKDILECEENIIILDPRETYNENYMFDLKNAAEYGKYNAYFWEGNYSFENEKKLILNRCMVTKDFFIRNVYCGSLLNALNSEITCEGIIKI